MLCPAQKVGGKRHSGYMLLECSKTLARYDRCACNTCSALLHV